MKQKKTQVIFYFLLFITLSFSSHAKMTDTSVFPVDLLSPGAQLEEMSANPDALLCVHKLPLKCPRKTTNNNYDHDKGCAEVHRRCVETCCHKIGRDASHAAAAERRRDCYARCDANYNACIRG